MADEHELEAWESHQLRATSPDQRRAFWLLVDIVAAGPTWAERSVHVHALAFERGGPSVVARADHRWVDMERIFRGPQIKGPSGRFEVGSAQGGIGELRWDLVSAGGLPPIRHLPHDFLYATGRANKKLLTPQPCLKVAGEVELPGRRWSLDGWVGLRTHVWGHDMGRGSGWLACHLWDDGAQRALEGFLGPSQLGVFGAMVVAGPRPAHWLRGGELVGSPTQELRSSRGSYSVSARGDGFLSLRSPGPRGEVHRRISPFAAVQLQTPAGSHRSQAGGLEFFDPDPPPRHAWPPTGFERELVAQVTV